MRNIQNARNSSDGAVRHCPPTIGAIGDMLTYVAIDSVIFFSDVRKRGGENLPFDVRRIKGHVSPRAGVGAPSRIRVIARERVYTREPFTNSRVT